MVNQKVMELNSTRTSLLYLLAKVVNWTASMSFTEDETVIRLILNHSFIQLIVTVLILACFQWHGGYHFRYITLQGGLTVTGRNERGGRLV